MLVRLAQALQTLMGPSLERASSTLARAALIALVATITIALTRAALALAARRYGWERGWIVRCPECGRLSGDPRQATCPQGHGLRFPPGAAWASDLRGRRARASALYSILLSVADAAAAFGVYVWLRIGEAISPLSRLTGAAAYFFFLAALYAADFALSSRPRGVGARLLHAVVALACLAPFLLLGLLSRGFEPAQIRVEGRLWATPAGVYLSNGHARRLGSSVAAVQARLIEARLPVLDLEWRGLAGFRVGEEEVPWPGEGGSFARWLDRWAQTLGRHGVVVRRLTEEVPLPPNVRVRISRHPEGFDFEPETGK